MLIGYARVSTGDQSLNITNRCAEKKLDANEFFRIKISGIPPNTRPKSSMRHLISLGLETALGRMETGSRLSRSLRDLIETVTLLGIPRDVQLKSLHESIDTASSSGKLIFHLFGALAEFERNLIKERTLAGLQAARTRGRTGGRPPSLDSEKRKLAVKLYNDKNYSVNQVCQMMGISKPTLYKYVRVS